MVCFVVVVVLFFSGLIVFLVWLGCIGCVGMWLFVLDWIV